MANDVDYSLGRIKAYYPLKGYGFISREKGRDLFFHRRDAADETSLVEGAPVRFNIEQTEKGPRAIEVARVG